VLISLDNEPDGWDSISSAYLYSTLDKTEKDIDFQFVVMKCLKKLSPKYNMILQLCFQQQLQYPEISEVLQIPLSTVKTHIRQALAALKKEILIELRSINKKAERKSVYENISDVF